MSRIGKAPIEIPDKVEVTLEGNTVKVKGPLGELSRTFRPEVEIIREGNVITVKRKAEDRVSRSLHGLSRTLLDNMVFGVSQGFVKKLEIQGVGYRAQVQGKKLVLQLGFSHPVELEMPAGIEIKVDKKSTSLEVIGADKQTVGDVAAKIRSYRPPEPYKGKGIRYADEHVRRKAGKAGK